MTKMHSQAIKGTQYTLIFTTLGLALIFSISIFSYWSGLKYQESQAWRDHSREVLSIISQLQIHMEQAQASVRGYVMSGSPQFLQPYHASLAEVPQDTEKLRQLVSDNPGQFQLAETIGDLIRQRKTQFEAIINLVQNKKAEKAVQVIRTGAGEKIMVQLREKFNQINDVEIALLQSRTAGAGKAFQNASYLIIFGLTSAFLLLLTVTVLLQKEISRRGKIESQLKDSQAKALEASSLKSQFLANMSHEIRTPLNGIIGMTKMLMGTELNPDQKEYLNTVQDSSNALLSLINGILDFSKIESGKLQLEEVQFELRSLIQSTQRIVDFSAREQGLEVFVQIDDNVTDHYIGDPLRIRQIILNLMNNAIKFSSKGRIDLKISLLREENSMARLQFEVKDQGVGIDPETKKKLFRSFSQGDDSTTRKYGGSGLGLAITRQLVEMMGGKIDVESRSGEGSRFFFDLSLKTAKYSAQQLVAKELDKNRRLSGHLLVAEDNITNQKVVSAMLKRIGCTYKIVPNGQEALQALKSESFDLVLMDAQMPIMDGYESTQRIRNGEAGSQFQNIPILAVTANAIKGDLEKCLEAGMNDYISKPISQEDLQMKLAKWLKTGSSVIDIEAIQKLQELETEDVPGLVTDVIKVFVDTGPQAIKTIRQAFQNKDFQQLNQIAHSFKSTCTNVGAVRMTKITLQIEKAKSEDDLVLIEKLIDTLENEHNLASQELKKYEAA